MGCINVSHNLLFCCYLLSLFVQDVILHYSITLVSILFVYPICPSYLPILFVYPICPSDLSIQFVYPICPSNLSIQFVYPICLSDHFANWADLRKAICDQLNDLCWRGCLDTILHIRTTTPLRRILCNLTFHVSCDHHTTNS